MSAWATVTATARATATAAALVVGSLGVLMAGAPVAAQTPGARGGEPYAALVSKALEFESAGKNREAIAAWREALAAGAVLPGALGLERVFGVLGQEDSVLAVLDTLVPLHPGEWQLRAAQLRTLAYLGLDRRAAAAFAAWRDRDPAEVTPYREYARVLLFNNRAAAADTVLRAAAAALGSTRALVLEVAQMRAGLGQWRGAAEAWRDVMATEPYYESATVFSLGPAPAAARGEIRAVLGARDVSLGATQALALLEVQWNAPRNGWAVLSALAPSDTVVAIWRQFADEVERARQWATAKDAFAAIHALRPDAELALRGAQAALRADDAATALRLARDAGARVDAARRAVEVLPVELEALARLGRAHEAEGVLGAAAPQLGPDGARGHARTIAWAWIRAGDIGRARLALRDAPLDAEDAVTGWLALFDGDLVIARGALRNTEVPGQDAVSALAIINRVPGVERAPAVGGAFLSLARGDSAGAARAFESATAELPDAASLLLTLAARIETSRRQEDRALALWTRVATDHARSTEAPEAQLEWARALRRRGDIPGAREHLETLILDYPGSALVPQARRELDALRAGV